MAGGYKIRLESGRILGPLDLERIRLLILKKHIVGTEFAREESSGDWVKIGSVPEIAEMLLAHAAGNLNADLPIFRSRDAKMSTGMLSSQATRILPGATKAYPVDGSSSEDAPLADGAELDSAVLEGHASLPNEQEAGVEEKTQIAELDPTQIGRLPEEPPPSESRQLSSAPVEPSVNLLAEPIDRELAQEKTQVLSRSGGSKRQKTQGGEKIKAAIAALALVLAAYEFLFPDPPAQKPDPLQQVLRPSLPDFPANDSSDPVQSQKIYDLAMKSYVLDTVAGYRTAAKGLLKAAALDRNNVKALALLASSYLNLIDSSNKDENYFSVISKLIEMTRAKNVDLPETVIADVEFFCVVNKAEAAQNRIIEYTKTHPSFGLEMFYYLSLAFYTRGDYQSASRYLSEIPDNKAFSAKVFYLQGQVAEKLGDRDSAMTFYQRALQLNPEHARSKLRVAAVLAERGRILEARPQLTFLLAHSALISPQERGLAYYLHSLLSEQNKNYELSLADAERAVRLDPEEHNYLLQLYSMRAKLGDLAQNAKREAKMYYYLGEGERLLKAGKYQDALSQFLHARQASGDSPIPLVKIGDMFRHLNDLGNARMNYKLAKERAPGQIEVWTKYIDALIQSYEWEEALQAMDKFRSLPVSQSAIDKAAGDIYAKQGQHQQAQMFYKKAMSRETIDSSVYIAYAKSLMATRNYKDAPFFFALGQRYDPLNVEAVVGNAKCIANTDSIDRAISFLQDELQSNGGSRAEIMSAIADFQIQKGAISQAQRTIEQAMNVNPDYAYPWKLQGQIYALREGADKKAMDHALQAYQAYSDRNPSDPSGYLERYQIFMRQNLLDKAEEELTKIYVIYPKYPKLHFFRGSLYVTEGNPARAIEEFQAELKNNPNEVDALLALGKELIEVGRTNEALSQFTKAMQLAPQSPEPKLQSGWANYLLKNYSGAIALYLAAAEKDPGNPLIFKRLGIAYRDTGDPQNAAAAFGKYLQLDPNAPDRAEIERSR